MVRFVLQLPTNRQVLAYDIGLCKEFRSGHIEYFEISFLSLI